MPLTFIAQSMMGLFAHLPLIMIVQAAVHTWELPVLVMFTLVCSATTAILRASYQLFVRYTPIGTLLDGPRQRPKDITEAVLAPSESSAR